MASSFNASRELVEYVIEHPILPGRYSASGPRRLNAERFTFPMSWPIPNTRGERN